MKNIVCYGDSNTWGFNAATKGRFPADVRWTGVLRQKLGEEYNIIEEGLNGRTTVFDDPHMAYRNGRDYIVPCLESHAPLDLVVLMLGTNDLKSVFSQTAYNIAAGAGVLAELVLQSGAGYNGGSPQLLLVSPILVGAIEKSEFADMFGRERSVETSKSFAKYYQQIADRLGCEFIDAALYAEPSPIDAIHMEPEEHSKLGAAIAEKVVRIL